MVNIRMGDMGGYKYILGLESGGCNDRLSVGIKEKEKSRAPLGFPN